MRKSDAPRPLTESTIVRAPCARSAGAYAAMSFWTPVEVSLCVSKTPLYRRSVSDFSLCASAAASRPLPGSVSSTSTVHPNAFAIAIRRFPKTPTGQASSASPGAKQFAIAASRPPVPDEPRKMTSAFSVPKSGRIPRSRRASSSANSGPRWLIIGHAIASSTGADTGTGPGISKSVLFMTLIYVLPRTGRSIREAAITGERAAAFSRGPFLRRRSGGSARRCSRGGSRFRAGRAR